MYIKSNNFADFKFRNPNFEILDKRRYFTLKRVSLHRVKLFLYKVYNVLTKELYIMQFFPVLSARKVSKRAVTNNDSKD